MQETDRRPPSEAAPPVPSEPKLKSWEWREWRQPWTAEQMNQVAQLTTRGSG